MEHVPGMDKASVNAALGSIYDAVISDTYRTRTLAELPNLRPTLKKLIDGLDNSLLANREFAFEIVRREQFPTRPSRMSCIFLIPDDAASVRFWWQQLQTQGKKGKRQLFRVKAEGPPHHRVSQDLLMPLQTCAIDEWTSRAHRYWADQPDVCERDEVLLVGKVTVEEKLDPHKFGCDDSV
jgi:hypothetical protein